MKKHLLHSFLLVCSLFFMSAQAQVCTPDPTKTKGGIYPDSATNFKSGNAGSVYNQVMTIVVPKDTLAIPNFPAIPFDSIVMTGLSGLPTSLTYSCNPTKCSWLGNSKGCILITGTPQLSEVGTHNLIFTGNAFVGGTKTPNPIVIKYYKIVIDFPVGTSYVLNNPGFSLSQNIPNPVIGKTQFNYTLSAPGESVFTIYNVLGIAVHSLKLNGIQGANTYEFDTSSLAAGVYTYSIYNGTTTLSKMMVVGE